METILLYIIMTLIDIVITYNVVKFAVRRVLDERQYNNQQQNNNDNNNL